MMDDTVKCVLQCLVCQRHQKIKPKTHKAMASQVTGLFDKIGIDCVFGLPTTENGYCGILVITEYLSKMVFAEPIKSKESLRRITPVPMVRLKDQTKPCVKHSENTQRLTLNHGISGCHLLPLRTIPVHIR